MVSKFAGVVNEALVESCVWCFGCYCCLGGCDGGHSVVTNHIVVLSGGVDDSGKLGVEGWMDPRRVVGTLGVVLIPTSLLTTYLPKTRFCHFVSCPWITGPSNYQHSLL